MMYISHKIFRLAVIAIVLLAILANHSYAQQGTGSIAKEGLLKALRKKVLSSKTLIRQIQRRGVTFQLNSEDELEIREVGKYLSKPGLDNLIAEIRKNYHPDVSQKPTQNPSLINQTMKDSPGGIQAGGNVTINQGVQPRKLTAEQEGQFVKILKDNVKGNIQVTCIESGGPEPCDFARQLVGLLESKDAGWTVEFSPLMFGAGDPKKTIPEMYILVQNAKSPPIRAIVLQQALKTVGYDAIGLERSDVAPDFVQLTIWFKNSPTGANPKQPASTSQMMISSPGAIQAGRDVVIQSDRRLIQSLELRISMDAETPDGSRINCCSEVSRMWIKSLKPSRRFKTTLMSYCAQSTV